MLEQFKGTSGVGLSVKDADDHFIRSPDVESRPVACVGEDHAIEPSENRNGRDLRDTLHGSTDGEDEPLLVIEGPHPL